MAKANGVKKAFAKAKNSIGAIAVTAVVLGGVGVIAVNAMSPRPETVAAGIQPVEATPGAKLTIDREEAELGTISVDEVASADFKLTNAGTAPVEISQVDTSCMCTFAEIELPGEKSPEFNMAMHNEPAANAWKGTLEPGETAVVTVTYQPSLMPVEGSVARNVKFATNDPQKPKVELGVHATVTGKSAG